LPSWQDVLLNSCDVGEFQMSLILADSWLITMNEQRDVLEGGSVCVDGDRIAAVGSRQQLQHRFPTAEVIDCQGRIVMPGMVNTHTHLFQTLLKGLGDDMVLKKWFTCMTGPSGVHLTPEDAYAAALHGCVESIRSGVTTLVDFMYVHTRPGMIPAIVKAYEQTGMRGFVCRGFLSTGEEYGVPHALIEEPENAIGDARAQMRHYNRPGARVQVGVAPNMIWAVDEKGYRLTRKLADEEHALITTHVAETTFELQTAASRYGQSDTEFLSEIGFLGPDVLAAHCVHCQPHDIRILLHHQTKVAHNPCSNMYLASGCPPIPEMLMAGVTVGLASDGPASSNNHSLFQAMKFAALIQKGFHQDATIVTAEKVLEMATIDGARAVGLDKEIGSIEPGKKADLVVLDYDNAFMTPIHHPVSAIVYSALGHEVSSVLIDGRFVMRDGAVTGVNEKAIRRQAQISADDLARRAGSDQFKKRPWRSTAI
jgi:5-methylthioadenosine/S-adenosylhomocysteine deaminase